MASDKLEADLVETSQTGELGFGTRDRYDDKLKDWEETEGYKYDLARTLKPGEEIPDELKAVGYLDNGRRFLKNELNRKYLSPKDEVRKNLVKDMASRELAEFQLNRERASAKLMNDKSSMTVVVVSEVIGPLGHLVGFVIIGIVLLRVGWGLLHIARRYQSKRTPS